MKRKLLFAALCVVSALGFKANAQASYNHAYTEGVAVAAGTNYFLYNIGAGKFLTDGMDWGTHATADHAGRNITFAELGNGKYSIYTASVSVNNGAQAKAGYMTTNGYLDTGTNDANWEFTLVSVGGYTNVYTIKNSDTQYLYYNAEDARVNVGNSTSDNYSYWIIVPRSAREAAKDYTFYLQNTDFNRPWERVIWAGTSFTNQAGGLASNRCAEMYGKSFDLYQTVSENVPNGKYILYNQAFYNNNDASNQTYLYANDNTSAIAHLNEHGEGTAANMDGASTSFTAGYYVNSVATVITDGKLKIGLKNSSTGGNTWSIFDNFYLEYLGTCLANDAIALPDGGAMTADTWYKFTPAAGNYNLTVTTLGDIVYTTDGSILTEDEGDVTTTFGANPVSFSATTYYIKSSSANTFAYEADSYDVTELLAEYNTAVNNANTAQTTAATAPNKASATTKTALDNAIATYGDITIPNPTTATKTQKESLETATPILVNATNAVNTSIASYAIIAAGSVPDNSLAGWTCENSNTFHINTWSSEGNSDGSNMTTPFIENWVSKGNYLGAGRVYYKLEGLEPGEVYYAQALVRSYNEKNADAPNGPNFFINNEVVDMTTAGTTFTYNGMSGIYATLGGAAVIGADGKLTLGVQIAEDRNYNWVAFKSVSIRSMQDALNDAIAAASAQAGKKMNTNVANALTSAIETYSTSTPTTVDGYLTAIETLEAVTEAAITSVANYEEANAIINAASELDENGQSVYNSNEDVLDLKGKYNNGTLEVVSGTQKDNCSEALVTATKAQTTDGANWTTAIRNNSFETGNLNGWSVEPSYDTAARSTSDGTYAMSGSDGKYLFNTWSAGNEISQTLDNMPAGAYRLTAVMATDAGHTLQLKMGGQTAEATSTDKGTGIEITVEASLAAAGNLTISAVTADNFWYKADNFRLTYVGAVADAADYAALNEAIAAHTLGFETGEYAPYNNVDGAAALATAKAIDQTVPNAKATVQDATSALTGATWTANATEVNAFFDGAFASTYSHEGNVMPIGWHGVGDKDNATNVRLMWNYEANAGLNATSSKQAAFLKFTGVYGNEAGYTLPLKAGIYSLNFIYGGWNEVATRDIKVYRADDNSVEATVNPSSVTAKDNQAHVNAESWSAYNGYVVIPSDGDYIFSFYRENTYSQNQLVFSDIELISAPATVTATITAAGFATLYTPFALDFEHATPAGLTAYTADLDGETVTLTAVNNVPAETGVVLKGAVGTYSIPVIASSSTEKGDLTGSVSAATAHDAYVGEGYYIYGLALNGGQAQFTKVTSGSVAPGKAFLKVSTAVSSKSLRAVVPGQPTEVTAPEVVETEEPEVLFNMAGIPVGKDFKGYVINQKGEKRLQR